MKIINTILKVFFIPMIGFWLLVCYIIFKSIATNLLLAGSKFFHAVFFKNIFSSKFFFQRLLILFLFVSGSILSQKAIAQNTIVNYDFNSGASFAALTSVLATNITSTATGSASFSTNTGVVSGANAFTSNATAGNALSSAVNNSWTFTVGGTNLVYYTTFKVYYQLYRASSSSNTITLSYSVNGGTFITTGITATVGSNPLTTSSSGTWYEGLFNLPVTADNPATSLAFKLTIGNNGSGLTRLDNFQVQADPPIQVSAFSGNTICSGSAGQLTASISGGTSPFTLMYNDGTTNYTANNVVTGSAFNVITNPVITTNYTLVSVTDANGVSRTTNFTDGNATITVNPSPTAVAFASSTSICLGSTVSLSSTGNSGVVNTASYTNSTSGSITDNNATGISRTITASGLPTSLASITNISVQVNVSHNNDADVELYLIVPGGSISNTANGTYMNTIVSGQSIALVADRGGTGNNFTYTVFSDAATTAISAGASPFNGTYKPEQAFSTLTGNPNGVWTLKALDDAAGTTGTLTNWTITFTYNNGVSYSWTSTPAGFTSSVQNPGMVSPPPIVSTDYNLQVSDLGNGCIAYDTVSVTVSQSPSTANAGTDQVDAATCGLTQITLAANTPVVGAGVWSIVSGTGGSFGNSSNPASTFTGVAGNAYSLKWDISSGACIVSSDTVLIQFNRIPTTSNAGADQTSAATCGLTTVTLAANTPTVGTGAWSIVSGTGGSFGNSSSATSTFTGISGNTYTLRWTISNSPCSASSDDVNITFNAAPTTANAGSDQTGAATCGLTTVTLAANVPSVGTGVWSIVSGTGGSFGNSSSATSTFSGTAGVSYTLRWTITNGICTSTDDVIVTFNINPTTANAGVDQTGAATCGLTSVTLAATVPTVGTGAWSIISGTGGIVTTASNASSNFSGTAGATYNLKWTTTNGVCTSSDTVVVTFNRNPTTANAGSDQTGAATCGLTTVTLAGNIPAIGTGTWSIVSGTGGSFGNASSATSTFSGVAGNTYTLRWTISSSPCNSSSDDVIITFNQAPTTAFAGADQNGASTCGLTQVTLAATPLTIGTGLWTILSGAGGSIGNTTSPTSTFNGTAGNTYNLKWATTNGICTSLDTVIVAFNKNPTTANAGVDQTSASTCGLTSVTMAGNTPALGTGLWSVISGTGGTFGNTASATSSFSGTAGTTYNLKWTTTNGVCTSSDTVVVTFNRNPTTANAGSDQTGAATCGLTTVTLAGNTPTYGTGLWTVVTGTGGTFGNANSPTSTFSGVAGTAYTLKWNISNSPCTASSDNVNITFNTLPSVSISANYCMGGGGVELTCSPAATSYLWSDGTTTMKDTVDLAGTYSVTVTNAIGCTNSASYLVAQELVVNGNFDAGNTGFTSGYTYTNQYYTTTPSGLWNEGLYAIDANAHNYHPVFYGTDHTTPGTGNFMIVNGYPNMPDVKVWQETVTINPNTTYYFSAWALSMNNVSPFAQLKFAVNDSVIGTTAVLAGNSRTTAPYSWVRFYGTWNSGPTATSAVISIVDLQTAAGGNDFGIDDISCSTLSPVTFSVNPLGNGGASVCVGSSLNFSANLVGGASPFTYVWTGPATSSFSSTLVSPTISSVAKSDSGLYTLKLTDGYGCTTTSTTSVPVYAYPVDKTVTAVASSICNGSSTNIQVALSQIGVTYQLRNDVDNSAVGSTIVGTGGTINFPTGALTSSTTYNVSATTTGSSCNIVATNKPTVTVNPIPTLTGASQPVAACPGSSTQISLTGLIANSTSTITYTINAGATQTVTGVVADASGNASFNTIALTAANNGQILKITGVTVTSATPNCSQSFAQNITLAVNALPTLTAATQSATVCPGSSATINLTGLIASSTSTITYTVNGGATQTVTGVVASGTGTASFSTVGLTAANNGQILRVTGVTRTNVFSNCTQSFAINVTMSVTASPTLGGASQSAAVCSGSSVTINLTGLIASSTSTITYTINGGATQTVSSVVANASGAASFSTIALTSSNNGQILQITGVTRTSVTPNCTQAFAQNVTLAVNTTPTLTGANQLAAVCSGSSAQINVTGLLASTTSTITYKINGGTTQTVSNIVSNVSGAASFTTIALTGANNGQILQITGVTTTSSIPNCSQTFTQNVTLAVNATTLTGATQSAAVCSGSFATINLTGLLANSTSTVTYTVNGGSTQTVTGVSANASGNASFTSVALTLANNGQILKITGVTNTSATPGCVLATAINVTMTVIASPTLSGALQAASVCAGSPTQINLTGLVANSTNSIDYTINGVSQTTVSGIVANATGAASFNSANLASSNNGQILQITSVSNGTCSQSFTQNATLSITSPGLWFGINTNWQDPQNWCGGVPTITTNVIIPNGVSFYPNINTGTGTVQNITIQSAASVIVTNAKLQIAGTISNSGSFNFTTGTLELSGAVAQTIAGSMFVAKTINDLIVSNTNANGVTISNTTGDSLRITDAVLFGNVDNAVLNTGDNLVLVSNASNTARVGDVTNNGVNHGNNISGKAIVERYLPMQNSSVSRRWRLLATPIKSTGAPTVNAAWQEGAVNSSVSSPINPRPGYGTQITNGNTAAAVANGFDMGSTVSPSIYCMNPGVSPNWVVPSTTSIPISNYEGYMIFVRGDRSIVISNQYVSATPATLEVKGNLNVGDVTKTLVTGKQVIGNPYASAIKFDNILLDGHTPKDSGNYFYYWDPKTSGSYQVGRFITVACDGYGFASYSVTGNVSGITDGTIQSGSAIVVESKANAIHSITFHEIDKISISSNIGVASRPADNSGAELLSKLYSNIYIVNSDGSTQIANGVVNAYYSKYKNAVDDFDAPDLISFNSKENLGIARDGQLLAIERRQSINDNDTIFLEMRNMNNINYRFEFAVKNLREGIEAYLEDSYLSTKTPINISDTAKSYYDFNVNSSIPTSAAINRFRIVFRPSTLLPVRFSSVKASVQNKNILVDWNVQSEVNVQKYIVEKSVDGINFSTMATVNAKGNNSSSVSYNSLDESPFSGANFYRIKSVDNNGTVTYSSIAKVIMDVSVVSSINVYPTVMKNEHEILELTNMPKGEYKVNMLNSIGQVVYSKVLDCSSGSQKFELRIENNLPKGMYQLEVSCPGNMISTFKVVNP